MILKTSALIYGFLLYLNPVKVQCYRIALVHNWVAVRRTYVFTLQGVEKICRTLQSHVMQVWTMTFWLLAPDPDKAEPLPVLSNKLPFFSTDALVQIA